MITSCVLILALVIGWDDPIVFWFTAEIGGQRGYAITKSQLDRSPRWADGKENPPLSARDARERGVVGIERLQKLGLLRKYPVKVVETSLRPIDSEKWMWIVTFEEKTYASSGIASSQQIAILMDGSILDPLEIDEILELEKSARNAAPQRN
jgi:hypothetical protein